jgi:hypothetical protein
MSLAFDYKSKLHGKRISDSRHKYPQPSLISSELCIDTVHMCLRVHRIACYTRNLTVSLCFQFGDEHFPISSTFQIKGAPVSAHSPSLHYQVLLPLILCSVHPAPTDSPLCIIKLLYQTQRKSMLGRIYQLKSASGREKGFHVTTCPPS